MFKEYFTNIETNLASKIPSSNTNPICYMSPLKIAGSFIMSPSTPNKIVEICAQLKNKNRSVLIMLLVKLLNNQFLQ